MSVSGAFHSIRKHRERITRTTVSQNRTSKFCRAKRVHGQGEAIVREDPFPTLDAPMHVTRIEDNDITGYERVCLAIALERPRSTTNEADDIVTVGMRRKRLQKALVSPSLAFDMAQRRNHARGDRLRRADRLVFSNVNHTAPFQSTYSPLPMSRKHTAITRSILERNCT